VPADRRVILPPRQAWDDTGRDRPQRGEHADAEDELVRFGKCNPPHGSESSSGARQLRSSAHERQNSHCGRDRTRGGLLLAATPASARTAAPKGSCKLLTVNEVGEILGTPAAAGKQKTRKGPTQTNDQCVWAAKKKGTGGLKGQPLQLELVVESGGSIVDDYQRVKAEDPDDTELVSGLGDDAFVQDNDLHVLVGAG
jgi:hypothetical protein